MFEIRICEVFGTPPHENPHVIRLFQIVALRIRVHQGTTALPILCRGLRVDHQRIGIRPFQNGVGLAGQMIRAFRIRERESVGAVVVVFVLVLV